MPDYLPVEELVSRGQMVCQDCGAFVSTEFVFTHEIHHQKLEAARGRRR